MVDIIGPMKGSPQERFEIVLVDLYSRWPEVAFCGEVTAGTVVAFLRQIFAREGVPEELVSDNGPQFRAAETAQFLQTVGVRHLFSSPYSPQTCGMVERLNRTVKAAIQSATLLRQSRVPSVQSILQTYRSTVHPATGFSPFRLMRGRDMRTGLDVLPLPAQPRPQLSERVQRYQTGYKQRFDARCAARTPEWKVGDSVFVRHHRTGKLTGRVPVKIQDQTGPVSFRLADGQRVHARRLVRAPATSARFDGPESFWWPSVSDESRPDPPAVLTPARPRAGTPDPSPALRRSQRTVRPPERYSP